MAKSQRHKLIVIVGPTASGKSALALRLAKLAQGKALRKAGIVGAEIVSADSRQVYRGMDIGTGKVTKKERRLVPHHLLDVADPKRTFTVAHYKRLAQRAVQDILRRDKVPIVVGGTGLYVDALVYNLAIPEVKPDKKLRAQFDKLTARELFEKLKKLDPRRAKTIDRHNKRRLVRALEIVLSTGRPVPVLNVASLYDRRGMQHSPYKVLWLGITWPKEVLAKRIKKRLDARLKQGMLNEVKKLRRSGVSWKRLESFGLEYKWLALYLQGKVTSDEMRERLYRAIVQYSKRQMTWFKRNKCIRWTKNRSSALRLVKELLF